jgi:serine phosphatase RsbU (regulator of sigma subunit)
MNRFTPFLFSILLFVFSFSTTAQQAKVDSLYRLYTATTVDTSKVNLLLEINNAYANFSSVKGVGYAREALELSERIGFYKGICHAHYAVGDYYFDQVNYSEAIQHFLKGVAIAENKKLYIELMNLYNRIGIVYSNQKKTELCMKYFLKVAELAKQENKPKRLAASYNNIGIACKDLGRLREAKMYYKLALSEFEKTGFKRGIASVNNGLGTVNDLLGNYDTALYYYHIAMDFFMQDQDSAFASGLYTNIGEVYYHKKEYKKSLECYQLGLKALTKYKNDQFSADAYDGISKLYASMHNYERAFYYKNRYYELRDSINDEGGMSQVREMEKRMENEKQEKAIEVLKQKEEIQKLKVKSQSEKLKQSNWIIFSVLGVLLIVLALSFFIFKAYKQIKKTNSELAEKKKEIQDSINYAKTIQEAMLPDATIMSKHFLNGGFGLYMPKDVVSGDFYWFNELNDTAYFAVADCTGHGVPGAFMSMIGIDKLNQSLIDKKIESPAAILISLNASIKKALKQIDGIASSRDGMDIALCSFNSTTKILHYSGANRPLWILRNKEILEYKPTKSAIAGHTLLSQEYESHAIQLVSNDIVYLFSDGFADQFGGINKKKFMTKQLKQALLAIHQFPLKEQEFKLRDLFLEWRGELEQIDDVLVLGMKV